MSGMKQSVPKSVDEYIAAQSEVLRPKLEFPRPVLRSVRWLIPNDELPPACPFPFPAANAEPASPRQLTIARPKDCFRFSFISLPFPLCYELTASLIALLESPEWALRCLLIDEFCDVDIQREAIAGSVWTILRWIQHTVDLQ